MGKEPEEYQRIERSIITKYRKALWNPFVYAAKRYDLIRSGDAIAVCISGGKDPMLMAKLLLRRLRQDNPNIEKSIFNSLHAVYLDTFPGYKTKGEAHSFLEDYYTRN